MTAPAILCQACVEIVVARCFDGSNEVRDADGSAITVDKLQTLSRDADQYRSKTFTQCGENRRLGMFAICLVDGHWVCAWHTRSYEPVSRGWVGHG